MHTQSQLNTDFIAFRFFSILVYFWNYHNLFVTWQFLAKHFLPNTPNFWSIASLIEFFSCVIIWILKNCGIFTYLKQKKCFACAIFLMASVLCSAISLMISASWPILTKVGKQKWLLIFIYATNSCYVYLFCFLFFLDLCVSWTCPAVLPLRRSSVEWKLTQGVDSW